jgi:hypothetical protein
MTTRYWSIGIASAPEMNASIADRSIPGWELPRAFEALPVAAYLAMEKDR